MSVAGLGLGYAVQAIQYRALRATLTISVGRVRRPLRSWLDKENSNNPATWARRLKNLRSFARYLQQFDPRTEVPDDSTYGRIGQRLAPHIYSNQDIIDLLGAARRLGPFPGLRGATYATAVRLDRIDRTACFRSRSSVGHGC